MRALRLLDKLLESVLVLLMAGLVINIIWQVASRHLFADPSSFTEEIARFLLLWIGLLGGSYAYRTRSHLGLDLVTKNMPPRLQRPVQGVVLAITALFALVVLVYGGGRLMWLTLELRQTSPSLGMPMGYVYGVLPLSGILIAFYSLVLWRNPHDGEDH